MVEYLNDASDIIKMKKVIRKMIFLFFSYLILLFDIIIKKQHKIAIKGIYKGL